LIEIDPVRAVKIIYIFLIKMFVVSGPNLLLFLTKYGHDLCVTLVGDCTGEWIY
jgi:hypothetical protein